MPNGLSVGTIILIVVPIILVTLPYLLLIKYRKQELSTSVHYAFRVTIGILLIWGIINLVAVIKGGVWVELILLLWMYLSIPSAAVCMVVTWSAVVLIESGWDNKTWQQHIAGSIIGIIIMSFALYIYRETMLLEPAMDRNTDQKRLRNIANGLWAKFDTNLLVRIAGNTSTPVDVLQQLAVHKEFIVRFNVCINSAATMDVFKVLIDERNKKLNESNKKLNTRACVAKHPNISLDLLTKMSKDMDYSVRYSIAGNTKTPLSILRVLSKDSNTIVRQRVASNQNTTHDVLALLANDSDEKVRMLIVRNTNVTQSLRIKLASDPSIMVRRMLVESHQLNAKILNILANDKDESISRRAKLKLKHFNR